MKTKKAFFFLLAISFAGPVSLTHAQAIPDDPAMISTQLDTSGFPQWAKDLRRAEIVAFGSFPFTYFFITTAFDTYRYARTGWDRRYAPWPITAAGGVDQTMDEKKRVLLMAAGSSILISLIDYGIVRFKRSREQREIRNLPPGTPIIIRKPLDAGGDAVQDSGEPESAGAGTP